MDINYIGTWTLFKKEVWRFVKVYNQTLIAPVVTSLLFLAVFKLSIGNHVAMVNGVPFDEFMASGLIVMTVVQQAFTNSSSSLTMAKVIGNVIDYLMPPISAGEFVLAMMMASMVRGFMVAVLSAVAIYIFIPFHIESPLTMLFYLFAASMMLSLLGILAGIISDSFEHMTAITSYVITPLAFLSGTFYSIKNLPEFWQNFAHFNPFFFMIDGFRYGMTGYADGNIMLGAIVLVVSNILLWVLCYRLIKRGYRIKG